MASVNAASLNVKVGLDFRALAEDFRRAAEALENLAAAADSEDSQPDDDTGILLCNSAA